MWQQGWDANRNMWLQCVCPRSNLSLPTFLSPSSPLPSLLRHSDREAWGSAGISLPEAEVHVAPFSHPLFMRSYREARGSVDIPLPEAEVHVACSDLDALQPRASVERLDPGASASRQLVAEMMILAGEAVGLLGGCGSRSGSRGGPVPDPDAGSRRGPMSMPEV